jgi:hypothetical protein
VPWVLERPGKVCDSTSAGPPAGSNLDSGSSLGSSAVLRVWYRVGLVVRVHRGPPMTSSGGKRRPEVSVSDPSVWPLRANSTAASINVLWGREVGFADLQSDATGSNEGKVDDLADTRMGGLSRARRNCGKGQLIHSEVAIRRSASRGSTACSDVNGCGFQHRNRCRPDGEPPSAGSSLASSSGCSCQHRRSA